MPIVILDGPEATGKSTIIDALRNEWGIEKTDLRSMGPKKSWLEYCNPLYDDISQSADLPEWLFVWSRCWASRTVYNELLKQGQIVPREVTRELDAIVTRSGGMLCMVTAPVNTLLERRLERLSRAGSKPDHQLDVNKELAAFQRYARTGGNWQMLHGTYSVEDNVRKIITYLVNKNPECRMPKEVALSNSQG